MNENEYTRKALEEFLQSFVHYEHHVDTTALMNQARTIQILDEMDALEVDIASRPCYDNTEDLLNAIREM
jgi:DNA repair ATPase RecN